MVTYFNEYKAEILNNIGRLSQAQKTILLDSKPIYRFWHISKIEKIGITTYSKIFNVCKSAVTENKGHQMSLFD